MHQAEVEIYAGDTPIIALHSKTTLLLSYLEA
jgi:hypothetical protein